MNIKHITEQIHLKKSFLCVGLDTDIKKIPHHLLDSQYQLFEFNRKIIDATAEFTVAYKANTAFYEVLGAAGWINLEMTVNYIRKNYPDIFIIADAKRGDIENTARYYAKTFFESLNVDAITISPYMGKDSVTPFLEFQDKWAIVLALTSNSGSGDFQQNIDKTSNLHLYENVLQTSAKWGSKNNMMFVIGATHADLLENVRKIVPDHFLLIPGVGAQSGNLTDVAKYGFNKDCGLLVNASRSIIYADGTVDFAKAAGLEAAKIQKDMESLLNIHHILPSTNN